jgi:hypothetical protein
LPEAVLMAQVKKASVIKEMKVKTGKFQKNKLAFILI